LGKEARREVGKSTKYAYQKLGGEDQARVDYKDLAIRKLVDAQIKKGGGLQEVSNWTLFKNVPDIRQYLIDHYTKDNLTKDEFLGLYKYFK
jgi:hypothetical protein